MKAVGSELAPIIFIMKLTHFGSEASKSKLDRYSCNKKRYKKLSINYE